MKNCYIHIPFCENICSYCDFPKLFYNDNLVDKYLLSLEKEIKEKYQGEELETLYIGGGTPSCLNIKQLKKLFGIIKIFRLKENSEVTIECNFDNTTPDKLLLFKNNRINRISYGLESINEVNLKILNRVIDVDKVKELIKFTKKIGINNINLDLMYGITPNINVLKKDVEFILEQDITHISTYSLIIEKNTKLYINNFKNIEEEIDYNMYQYIKEVFSKNNFNHYETSNFSKVGYESKHNLCYWNNNTYYGFGLGAASYIDNKRIINTRSINKYILNEYIKDIEILTIDDVLEYEILLGFRKIKGLNKSKFIKKFNKQINEYFDYSKLIEENYIKENENYIFINQNYLYLSNSVIVKFLESRKNEK